MTVEQISELASKEADTPSDLTQPELSLFLSLKALYIMYRLKQITKEQAKRDKQRAIDEYHKAELSHHAEAEMIRRLNNCGTLLSGANKNGCEVCKKMAKLITGIL